MSSSSSSSSTDLDNSFRHKLSRVPAWIPAAAFAGTTIALAIPMIVLARQRHTILRKGLSESSAPPPLRRASAGSTSGGLVGPRIQTSLASSTPSTTSKDEFSSPGTGELLSVVSKADLSTAMFAGKALAIATGIVTVSGIVIVTSVKAILGVNDTKEFADKVRMIMWRNLPGLTSHIHRPPSPDERDIFSEDRSTISTPPEEWSWFDAEKRLQAAWDRGFSEWVKAAAAELEAELRIERAKRSKEYEDAEAKRRR